MYLARIQLPARAPPCVRAGYSPAPNAAEFSLVRRLLYPDAIAPNKETPMQLPSFTTVISLLVAGAISARLAGMPKGPAEDALPRTAGALVRAVVADRTAVTATAPATARTAVANPDLVATAVTTTSTRLEAVDYRANISGVLAQDFQLASDVSSWNSPAELIYTACRGTIQMPCSGT